MIVYKHNFISNSSMFIICQQKCNLWVDEIVLMPKQMFIINSSIQYFEIDNMMMETILSVERNLYPFDESISASSKGMVEQLEYFENKQKLLLRRSEIRRHMKVFQSNFIIKLLKIYQEDLCLHYIYEYVPISLSTYIRNEVGVDQNRKFREMTAKILYRRIVNEINTIVIQLAKMRIQTQFHFNMLGVHSNKIKIYINSHHQVGRKSELLLKDFYRSRKEAALRTLEQQFQRIICEQPHTPNFVITGNKLSFHNGKRQGSNFNPHTPSQSNNNSFCLNDTYINCETKDSNFNQAKQNQRRFSQTKWDQYNQFKQYDQKLRNTQTPIFSNNFNPQNKSQMSKSNHFQEDFEDDKSYCHSKSIRIELQKNNSRKHRKDSYKVKIITCHQYEMEDIDPRDLFQKCNISQSMSQSNYYHKQPKKPTKKEFEERVKKAAEKARQLLKGYLHNRRHSRK